MVAAAGGVHSSLFPHPRTLRLPLGATLHQRTGAEGDIEIRARGWRWVFPHHVTLLDALLTINGRPPKENK